MIRTGPTGEHESTWPAGDRATPAPRSHMAATSAPLGYHVPTTVNALAAALGNQQIARRLERRTLAPERGVRFVSVVPPLARAAQARGRCACGGLIGADGQCDRCRARAGMQPAPPSDVATNVLARVTLDPIRRLSQWMTENGVPSWLAEFVNCQLHLNAGPAALNLAGRILQLFTGGPDPRNPEDLQSVVYAVMSLVAAPCECVPPAMTKAMVSWHFKREGYPDALDSWEYYASGKGGDHTVDIGRMIDEDAGVKRVISDALVDQSWEPGRRLPAPKSMISQGGYRTKNWWYTFGNVDDVFFLVDKDAERGKVTEATVTVEIRDPYEWHPDNSPRGVPCLHTAAENMKLAGAKDFFQVGTAARKFPVLTAA